MHFLPFSNGFMDDVTAGWALGHFCGWYPDRWKQEMSLALQEMHRVSRPGSHIIILETLSTGNLTPVPPNQDLAEYYNWLEDSWGFSRLEISTDYQFGSVKEAIEQTEFFFGEGLSHKIRENQWSVLLEWTGLWSKQI